MIRCRLKNTIRVALVGLLFCECENLFFETDGAKTDPYTNFNYLWHEIKDKYAFFQEKPYLNWEEVRTELHTRLNDDMSDNELLEVLGDLIAKLKDVHSVVENGENKRTYLPSVARGEISFDENALINYEPENDKETTHLGDFKHYFLNHKDLTAKQVGYIRYAKFTYHFTPSQLNTIIKRYKNCDALIWDVRQNPGGAVFLVYEIISRFVDESISVFTFHIKTGPGANDFKDLGEVTVSPKNEKFTKKVYLLTDRGTYSAGSIITLCARAAPRMTVVGDTTGGGLGIPNGGILPNGWKYGFSVSKILEVKTGKSYEESGIPPDYTVHLDLSNPSKDEVIEKAVDLILKR